MSNRVSNAQFVVTSPTRLLNAEVNANWSGLKQSGAVRDADGPGSWLPARIVAAMYTCGAGTTTGDPLHGGIGTYTCEPRLSRPPPNCPPRASASEPLLWSCPL